MARRLFNILILGVVIGFGVITNLSADPKPPPFVTDGPKPFLSLCTETNGAMSETTRRMFVHRPGKQGVAAPFYDQPFALHVPVEVRHEGGIARITCQVKVHWDNPPSQWADAWARSFRSGDFGIYRGDGAALAEGTVIYDRNSFSFNLDKARRCIWDAISEVPSWTFPAILPDDKRRYESFSVDSEESNHVVFASSSDRLGFVIAPCKPGVYVLWIAFNLGERWPDKDPKRTEITGALRVDTAVSRSERGVTESELAYLAGRGPRPAAMAEDNLFRVTTSEVPLTLRRDGWKFDHAEVRPLEQSVKQSPALFPTYLTETNTEVQSSASAGGPTVTLKLDSATWDGTVHGLHYGKRPAQIVYRDKNSWQIALPLEVPDYGFATMTVGGGKECWYNLQSDNFRGQQDPKKVVHADFYSPNWEPDRITSLDNKRDSSSYYQSSVVGPMSEKYDLTKAPGMKKYFLDQYGPDALDWWHEDFYKDSFWYGPQDGEPPFRYSIRGSPLYRDEDRKFITTDAGTYPLMTYRVGPWLVIGHYRRLKDAGAHAGPGQPTGGDVTVTRELDPFWKWFPGLSRVLREQLTIVSAAYVDASFEAEPLQQLLRSAQRLGLDIGAGEGDATVQQTDAAFLRKVARLRQISTEIRARRVKLDELTARARAALQVISDTFADAYGKFGERHPELLVWRKPYREMQERVALDIAMQAKDRETLRKALDDAATSSSSVRTRLIEAELHLADGNAVAALTALRSAVRIDPDDDLARKKLADLECAFLKHAIDKSQGAIKEARAAFYGYMLERGFSDRDITVQGELPFARAVSWSTSALQVYGEEAWAVFTTGLFGSFSAFAGKPAAEADLLATTERQMTTAFVGLNTMLRLRSRGYTFDQIGKMTSIEVRDRLPLRDVNGNLYSDQQAALHCVAIREAIKLPDVQALIADDEIGLQLGLKQAYWNNKDVGDTWLEWIGDATSVYNLLMMLPGAKVGMAGRAGLFWTEADVAMMQELEKLNKVITGTEAIANTVGLTRALNAAGATESGRRLVAFVTRLDKYQQGLQWYDKVIWTSGKITGLLALNAITVTATEKIAGHKAAMLMQIALMFGTDSETLFKLLKGRNIPPEKVAALVINEYLPATRVHLKRLAQMEKSAFELRDLFERVKKGRPLSADDIVFLDKYFESSWRKLVPNGQASHDVSLALGAGAEGARNGINNGASDAVHELENDLNQEQSATAQSAQDAEQLANGLDQNASRPRGPPPAAEPPPTPRNLNRATFQYPRAPDLVGSIPLPPRPKPGSACSAAEALLHAGKYHEAQEAYEAIIDRILKGELFIADEMPLEYIHLKRCLAYELQASKRGVPGLASKVFNHAPPAATVEEILADPSKWRGNPEQGVMGEVFTVEGHPDYLVKVVHSEREVEIEGQLVKQQLDVLADIENNRVHADLAHALGIDTPGFDVRIVYDADGKVEKAIYVMRKVDGGALASKGGGKSAAEVFLYKDELSRHRALAVLLGDFDRKADNYMLSADGRLFAIDAGVADVRGERLGFFSDPDQAYAYMIEGRYGRDHWLSRFFKDEITKGNKAPTVKLWATDPESVFARKGLVAEEALTYQAAKPTVDSITDLLKPEKEAALRDLLTDSYSKLYLSESEIEHGMDRVVQNRRAAGEVLDLSQSAVKDQVREQVLTALKNKVQGKVDASVTAIRTRAARLDECMRGLNQRNSLPLPGAPGTSRLELDPTLIDTIFFQHLISTAGLRRAA